MSSELVIHQRGYQPGRVLCGQIKMRDSSRLVGLRYTAVPRDVTCRKCLKRMWGTP